MSAQTATVVDFPPPKRALQAQPVAKHRVFEHVRALICEGDLLHIDMNVVQYLAQITDKVDRRWPAWSWRRSAERIGRSRSTVVRSVRRLIDAGVIDREEQRTRQTLLCQHLLLGWSTQQGRPKGCQRRYTSGSRMNLPRFTSAPLRARL